MKATFISKYAYAGLTKGRVYEVRLSNLASHEYSFDDDDGDLRSLNKSLFSLVTETPKVMKAKCIESRCALGFLTKDKVYQVRQCPEFEVNYDVVDDTGRNNTWKKERFEPISSEASTIPHMVAAAPASPVSSDIEEEKCWKAMRPTVDAGHCVCGIMKVDCRYHQ